MFERYTEKARRAIFFARYEASQYGSPYIETEHLLLGLLREDRALAKRFLGEVNSEEGIRAEIERHTTSRERISTSVEVPLTLESKKILNLAAEEADRPGHRHIGTEPVFTNFHPHFQDHSPTPRLRLNGQVCQPVPPGGQGDGIPGGEEDGHRSGHPAVVGRREDSSHSTIDRCGPEHGAADRALRGERGNRAGNAVTRRR